MVYLRLKNNFTKNGKRQRAVKRCATWLWKELDSGRREIVASRGEENK